MEYVMICSSSECDFSKTNKYKQGVDRFCPTCGKDMFWKCPQCDRPLRDEGAVFCSGCGERIKPPAPSRKDL